MISKCRGGGREMREEMNSFGLLWERIRKKQMKKNGKKIVSFCYQVDPTTVASSTDILAVHFSQQTWKGTKS